MKISTHNDLLALSSAMSHLPSEQANALSTDLDSLSPIDIARLMNEQDKTVALAVEGQLVPISQAIQAAANSLKNDGRIIYVGAGTSGRLGMLDAAECPPTFSTPVSRVRALIAGGTEAMLKAREGAEDEPDQGALDLLELNVTDADTVVGLAASGRTPYVVGALQEARQRGATTVGVSCNGNAPLSNEADIAITPIVGPEILAGSTRLKSGTAQKMVLNMISTGAMVRIGKCYGNRMVDLKASNEKLRARALNLVQELTPCETERALQNLLDADWDIKTAILVGKTGLSPASAQNLIAKHGGHLRKAIQAATG